MGQIKGEYFALKSTKRAQYNYIIYFWEGSQSHKKNFLNFKFTFWPKIEKMLLARGVESPPIQVRVVQNKEPNHFLVLFKGKMVVHNGAVDSAQPNAVHLYHVRGTNDLNTRAVEVEATAHSLNSNDSFVLKKDQKLYSWYGKGSNEDEKQLALRIAKCFETTNITVKEIEEGNEDNIFWSLLGGKATYASDPYLQEVALRNPRLFHCSNASGAFKVEEILNFTCDDLINDDVMILDTHRELYVWVGNNANAEEKEKSMEIALEYTQKAPGDHSNDMCIIRIEAGNEPPMFTCHFHGWVQHKETVYEDPYEKRLRLIRESEAKLAAAQQSENNEDEPEANITQTENNVTN